VDAAAVLTGAHAALAGLLRQVCTGVMVHGYPLVKHLCGGLQAFMSKHGFESIDDFRGAALPYFTSHTDLVARQRAAIAERKAAKVGLANDQAWTGAHAVWAQARTTAHRQAAQPPDCLTAVCCCCCCRVLQVTAL
jgi:hypothetical protein